MALNIKDAETEALAAEVAALTGESKTAAVRAALAERRYRLQQESAAAARRDRLRRFLETEAWPLLQGHGGTITKQEREAILGYGPEGV